MPLLDPLLLDPLLSHPLLTHPLRLDPLAAARSLVDGLLAAFHAGFVAVGLPPSSGAAWLLAVALLVVLVRTALLPLVVRQFRTGVRMRALAPELRRLRARYPASKGPTGRAALARETAALHRRHGVRPLAALVPMVLQVPLFLAVVQALEQAAHGTGAQAVASFATATLLGVPLAATALSGGLPGAVLGGALLAVSAGSQLWTQHLAALTATAEGMPGGRLLLALPVVTALTGLAFPIGVTAYWCASALWSLAQQAVLTRATLRRP